MPWDYVNPYNEPESMVETAFSATMTEEEYSEMLSTGTDFEMGYRIAEAYNKCGEIGVSVTAQSPKEEPYFKGRK